MSPRRGFSLLEVMVAGALFLTSLSGVITAIGALNDVEAHQRRMSIATTLGEQTMEELLLRWGGHPDIDVGTTTSRFFDSKGTLAATAQPLGYEARWSVTRVDKIQNLKEVRLRVIWTENSGTKDISYFTYRP